MAGPGPINLDALAALPLAEWVSSLRLGSGSGGVLAQLDEWGVSEPADMIYLETKELQILTTDLKLVQKRKLEKAVAVLARAAELDLSPGEVLLATPASPTAEVEVQPEQPPAAGPVPPSDDEFALHVEVLKQCVGAAGEQSVEASLNSIQRCWTACVADPSKRSKVLPSLFAIARANTGTEVEREAGMALVFLAFSLSGTVVSTFPSPKPAAGPTRGAPTTVLILGWLGSGNDDFAEVVKHYHSRYPGCKVVVTVGGNDLWPGRPIPQRPQRTTADGKHLRTAMTGAAPWPASGLCAVQLARLAAEMEGSKVLVHSFSNNGIMLYTRLLRCALCCLVEDTHSAALTDIQRQASQCSTRVH
jgi:hypothetical protein